MPWLLHKSEHSVPMTEFPISRMTVVTDGGGDSPPWTLWAVKDETEATEAVAVGVTTVIPATDDLAQTTSRYVEGFDEFLLDVLRNRLCGNRGNQGDVLHSSSVRNAIREHSVLSLTPNQACLLGNVQIPRDPSF